MNTVLANFWEIWSPNLVMDIGRYVVAASLMALILKIFWPKLRHRKIQTRFATDADVRREILTSLRTGVIFSLTGVLIFVGATHGIFTVYMGFQNVGYGYFAFSVIAMIVAHDAYFYWTHRLMHHPKLFRFFHRTHHKSIAPTPFAAYAFDIPEALVISAFVPLWLLFVPMHALGLFLFMAFQIVRNVMGHSGVELMPRRLADSKWFGWINATTHHDLHHATFNYNYGLYFTWWDKLMGTEHPAYRERLRGKPQIASVPASATAAWPTKIGTMLALIATLSLTGTGRVAAEQPNSVFGRWLTENRNGVVEIFSCEKKICGRLVWFKAKSPGTTSNAVDDKNPNAAQRQRSLCELVMLGDFQLRDANHFDGGWVYSPDNGKTYRATLTLEKSDVLKLRGYVGVPLFGETQTWTRVDRNVLSCKE